MAQQIIFWKMEGASDIELKVIRLKNKSEIAAAMTLLPEECDVATLSRTDKRSLIVHEIWKSKRYIDLNERD